MRFCVSAGHTRADLDKALSIIDEVADLLWLRYRVNPFGYAPRSSPALLTAAGHGGGGGGGGGVSAAIASA